MRFAQKFLARFVIVIKKESRHPESESKRAMTGNKVHNIVVHMGDGRRYRWG